MQGGNCNQEEHCFAHSRTQRSSFTHPNVVVDSNLSSSKACASLHHQIWCLAIIQSYGWLIVIVKLQMNAFSFVQVNSATTKSCLVNLTNVCGCGKRCYHRGDRSSDLLVGPGPTPCQQWQHYHWLGVISPFKGKLFGSWATFKKLKTTSPCRFHPPIGAHGGLSK